MSSSETEQLHHAHRVAGAFLYVRRTRHLVLASLVFVFGLLVSLPSWALSSYGVRDYGGAIGGAHMGLALALLMQTAGRSWTKPVYDGQRRAHVLAMVTTDTMLVIATAVFMAYLAFAAGWVVYLQVTAQLAFEQTLVTWLWFSAAAVLFLVDLAVLLHEAWVAETTNDMLVEAELGAPV